MPNIINFFWSGDNWTFLHDLTIKSHIVVGHKPVIWLHGDKPRSKYWNTDLYGNTENADDIIDISQFMRDGGNFKTASSLWRFTFLHRYGGWYSDTDAIALKEWPDIDWVICGEEPGILSTGVIKVPKGQEMFLHMIGNMEYVWGNVDIFNKYYLQCHGNITETVNSLLFYPLKWREWRYLLSIMEIPDVYSVHLYHTMFEKYGMISDIEGILWRNKETMLSKIWVSTQLRL